MLFLQVNPSDTTRQAIKAVSDATQTIGVWDSIIIPVAILLFFSLIKYFTGRIAKNRIWFDFAAEAAIDILSVFVTFIIGRNFMSSTSSALLISSTGKIAIIAVVAIILSLIRVGVNKAMLKSNPELVKAGGLLLLEYSLSVSCVIMIFKF
jgi:hypothetical protein